VNDRVREPIFSSVTISNQEPRMNRRRFRIVAVADALFEQRLRATLLERRAFDVNLVNGAAQAFAMTLACRADLVLLRERMTDATAVDGCARIRAHSVTRSVAVIVLLDEDTPEARERCQLAGAVAALAPQASGEELMRAVASALNIPARRTVRMTVMLSTAATRETLGRAVDISEGGLGLEVDRPYPVDTAMRLRFQLPGERKGILCGARVRWVDTRGDAVYALGLQFTDFAPEHRDALHGYLDRALAAPAERHAARA
jgi:CheY-like chemotaxis protein